MSSKKGEGVAGGGLKARIAAWEALPGAMVLPGKKHVTNYGLYMKPGSQNSRKGGRGKNNV